MGGGARLSAALGATAQLIAFAAVGAPLSYLGASLKLPLHHAWLDRADRMPGFDWDAMLVWMNAHSAIHPVFREIYWSLMPQTIVIVLALAWAGKFAPLRTFMLAFMVATLATIAIAAVLPAEGVWAFRGIQHDDFANIAPATRELHMKTFNGLRNGTFRQLPGAGAASIITFPSLHSALAVLLAAGLWPLPVLRWIGVALNAIMLVSIPIDGGHYVVDILAGIAIAVIALAAAHRFVLRCGTAGQRAIAGEAAGQHIAGQQPAGQWSSSPSLQ